MARDLLEYNEKRDFEKTNEPKGETDSSEDGLRFVVQHHMARREHYDFRLEWGGVLLSWAVPKGPSYNKSDKRLAVHVEDHPLEYRNFEGIIPKGEYGGGIVMLWDEGYWEPYGNVDEGLQEGVIKFELKGSRLQGKWALIRLKSKSGKSEDNWLLLKEKDEYVKDSDGISQYVTSIRTGRTMDEIEKGEEEKITKNPFTITSVQLAKMVKTIPQEEDWIYELKYDGYRIIAYVEGNKTRLITRNNNDYSNRFHEIVSSLNNFSEGRAMVLDGEIVVTDKAGKTDFQALQNYLKSPRGKHLTYIVFDLLALDGVDLRVRPLIERKVMLETLLKNAPSNLYYSRYIEGKGKESFAAACETGMEGIIGKRAGSVYSGTRNGDWIKLKCDKRQEFVIGGYSISDKRSSGVSSLLLGVYEGDDLVYAGRAGTGFSESDMKILEDKFQNIKRQSSPFREELKEKSNESIIWLEPQFVAEIKFAEWTEENLLRQASYKGLRSDKDPRTIVREKAVDEDNWSESLAGEEGNWSESSMLEEGIGSKMDNLVIQGIKISNPGKVVFEDPKITKEEVVRYYAQVAERMLPYVGHRLLSTIRCPKGISQACFFKKHPGPGSKEVKIIPVSNSEGETEEYFYVESPAGLVSEAQMGTLEFHVWGSSVDTLEMPDMMVFDLDPDEGMDLSKIRQGVLDVKSVLTELSLQSYLKTSGGKGYHVVVPLKPAASWEVFYEFSRRVAEVMTQMWPDRYTSNVRKSKRTGKIFIDWMRNGRGATSVAPYSLRARKGAKVSMPIGWDELDTVDQDGITMEDALQRIRGIDPWEGFFRNEQSIK